MIGPRCARNTQRLIDHKKIMLIELGPQARAPPVMIRRQDDVAFVGVTTWRDEVAPTPRQLSLRQQEQLLHTSDCVHLDRWKHRWPLILVAKAGLERDVYNRDGFHNISGFLYTLEDHVTLTTLRLNHSMRHETSGAA